MTRLRPQEGFTVVEVLVGAILATLVALLGYSAFLAAARMHLRWNENVRSAEAVHLQTRQVQTDLRRSDQVVETAECLWLLITAYHDSVSYARAASVFLRNGEILELDSLARPLQERGNPGQTRTHCGKGDAP